MATPGRGSVAGQRSQQSDQRKSLPCSHCCEVDVALYPAVACGIVSLELAAAFIPDEPSGAGNANRKRKIVRRNTRRVCLTLQSEVERMRANQIEETRKSEEKQKRNAEKLKRS